MKPQRDEVVEGRWRKRSQRQRRWGGGRARRTETRKAEAGRGCRVNGWAAVPGAADAGLCGHCQPNGSGRGPVALNFLASAAEEQNTAEQVAFSRDLVG